MTREFTISYDAADDITKNNLIEVKEYLTDELQNNELYGTYLHPDDIKNFKKLIKSLNRIINYYGGE